MIVQDPGPEAPPDRPRLVITMAQHTATAGQLAAALGGGLVERPEPFEEFVETVASHDAGWAAFDGRAPIDLSTGLPFHLLDTPPAEAALTPSVSADVNEKRSPWSGLLSSLHSSGLYNGRFGTSEPVVLDLLPVEHRPTFEAILKQEAARRDRLRSQIEVDEAMLWHAYLCLQFCDAVALWLQSTAPARRAGARFENVPTAVGADLVSVVVEVSGDSEVAVSPWPFGAHAVGVEVSGRWIRPAENQAALDRFMAEAPVDRESVQLVRFR